MINIHSLGTRRLYFDKISAQKREGSRKRASPIICILPMAPCASSSVTRMSLAFRPRLCAKKEVPEQGGVSKNCHLMKLRIFQNFEEHSLFRSLCLKVIQVIFSFHLITSGIIKC